MYAPLEWLNDHTGWADDACLPWPFAKDNRTGRGSLRIRGKSCWAHRLMCEIIHGPAPADKPQAAHSCGNGHLGCVNPKHLSWSDNSGNQLHRYQGETPCNRRGNKERFTPEEIAVLRSQWGDGDGQYTQVELGKMYGLSLGGIQYYLKYRPDLETTVTNGN